MAVKFMATIQQFIGLSSDTKPVGVSVGSTFFEHNTGNTYITHDGTNWVLFGISQYSY